MSSYCNWVRPQRQKAAWNPWNTHASCTSKACWVFFGFTQACAVLAVSASAPPDPYPPPTHHRTPRLQQRPRCRSNTTSVSVQCSVDIPRPHCQYDPIYGAYCIVVVKQRVPGRSASVKAPTCSEHLGVARCTIQAAYSWRYQASCQLFRPQHRELLEAGPKVPRGHIPHTHHTAGRQGRSVQGASA